jgi:SsrA-binding protein
MSTEPTSRKQVANNKKAFFNYEILDKLEVGVQLVGCEVKSIREGHVHIRDAYARIVSHELWLLNCLIDPYSHGNRSNPDPLRNRKLLIHRYQLVKWAKKVGEKGLVIVPLQLYLTRGKVKIEIGLGRPKKLHDKRESIKEKDISRQLAKVVKNRY